MTDRILSLHRRAVVAWFAALIGSTLAAPWAVAGELPAGPVTRIEVLTRDDVPLDLGVLRGRLVVVYVWGEWCRACERSTPAILDLAQQQPGVSFVFINTDTPPKRLRVAPKDLPVNVIETRVSEFFFDPETRRKKRFEFSQLGLVFGIPAYALLDAAGHIRARGNGSRYPAALAEAVASLQTSTTLRAERTQ